MTHDPAPLDRLKTEIRARLEHLCTHFAPEEFEELVADIARVKLQYGPDHGVQRSTTRPAGPDADARG